MRKYFEAALKVLTKVFTDGTYGNLALSEEPSADMTTKLVYGVLEQNIKIEFILSGLVEKKPKTPIWILLKIGTYALLNLTDVPQFAIVSECVETAKELGKGGAGGFLNAVLKKVASGKYTLPGESDENYLSVFYSKPQWFINKLTAEFGKEAVSEMLNQPDYTLEHIRVNKAVASVQKVKAALEKDGGVRESEAGGLCVKATDEVKKLFVKGAVTYQSPSSMLAVQALQPKNGSKILDICSAPGGKAVYIAELCPNSEITACDIYPHRVELIKKYAARMKTPNVKPVVFDAAKFNKDWENEFDYVLLDAPCSCFGTYGKHPDVFLNKGADLILKMAELQKKIAEQAVKYVKKNGILIYSTCTLFKEENGEIVDFILNKYGFSLEKAAIPFENDGFIQILPHGEWDGFYIARMRKTV